MDKERYRNNWYDSFFLAGSFLMVPELMFDVKSRQLTEAAVRMGLALDDVWDFGLKREYLANNGFIEPDDLNVHADHTIYQHFITMKLQLRMHLNSLPNSPTDRRAILNMERFEQNVMLVEGLALAIPYNENYWTGQLFEQYRCVDALVWGAMYVALKPKASLVLPDQTIFKNLYISDPVIGMSRLYTDYYTGLLKSGKEGHLAISLALQMLYVQIQMDLHDKGINRSYHSPGFTVFPDNNNLDQKKLACLENSRCFSPKLSITRTLARLFPLVYGCISHSSSWRRIKGWGNVYSNLRSHFPPT